MLEGRVESAVRRTPACCVVVVFSNVVERALGLNTLGHAQETLIDVALASDER